ncbi:MAG TPA: CHAT domain-containing protein, partial [Symbiobacteriaceae bacterium]|nr:CHAT domain-containing protein [Symbiobacteriaceae bacterium]
TFKATEADLDRVLSDDSQATNVLHFACHGEADPRQPEYNRIVLGDNVYLTPWIIRGSDIGKKQPFVFLNACQVGQGGETLGEYAGFAGAFLKEGCPGFLGPLWAVDDVIAREVAEQFYTEACRPDGRTVGEVLRDLRCRFATLDGAGGRPAATYLAYVYYGHPNLRLVPLKGA